MTNDVNCPFNYTLALEQLTAIRSSSVALPLEGDEVGQVVVQAHAVASGVAPIVHLAAPERFGVI